MAKYYHRREIPSLEEKADSAIDSLLLEDEFDNYELDIALVSGKPFDLHRPENAKAILFIFKERIIAKKLNDKIIVKLKNNKIFLEKINVPKNKGSQPPKNNFNESFKLKRNYYEVLGIKKNASKEQLRLMYEKLVKIYHPDVGRNLGVDGEKPFREIKEAYEILIDPKKEQNMIDH